MNNIKQMIESCKDAPVYPDGCVHISKEIWDAVIVVLERSDALMDKIEGMLTIGD